MLKVMHLEPGTRFLASGAEYELVKKGASSALVRASVRSVSFVTKSGQEITFDRPAGCFCISLGTEVEKIFRD